MLPTLHSLPYPLSVKPSHQSPPFPRSQTCLFPSKRSAGMAICVSSTASYIHTHKSTRRTATCPFWKTYTTMGLQPSFFTFSHALFFRRATLIHVARAQRQGCFRDELASWRFPQRSVRHSPSSAKHMYRSSQSE
jgi:hypothetical protein